MKKNLPLFLIIASLCLVVVGVFGLLASGNSGCASNNAGDGDEKTGKGARGNLSADRNMSLDLLEVGMPSQVRSQMKDYEGFTVSFNADNHTPNFVAWELLAAETDGQVSRSGSFWKDEEIEGCPDADDYKRSGFDRGHLCPAADQKWSRQAMTDCFSFANMAPQHHALNAGAWQTLEKKVRLWATRDSALLIVAGPLYEKNDTLRIGNSGVRVPSAFFKVIAAPFIESPRGIAFVYPNMTSPGNMENYVMTIDDVEKLTGFDFFHNMPDDIEHEIESTASFRDWNK